MNYFLLLIALQLVILSCAVIIMSTKVNKLAKLKNRMVNHNDHGQLK